MNSDKTLSSSSVPFQFGPILPFSVPLTAICAISSAVRPVLISGDQDRLGMHPRDN